MTRPKHRKRERIEDILADIMHVAEPAKLSLEYYEQAARDIMTARHYEAEGDTFLCRYFSGQARQIHRLGVRYSALARGLPQPGFYYPVEQ